MGPEIYAEFTSRFGNPNARPEVVKLYVEGIRAGGRRARVRLERHRAAQLELAAGRARQRAKVLRANGFTERELDLLLKINPAKILGIAPPPAGGTR